MNNNKVGVAGKLAGPEMKSDFMPGGSLATSTIEISISCRNLANKDVLSKSDPMCVIYHKPMHSKTWIQLLKTEALQNNLNPNFSTKLKMEYRFEAFQNLRFEVYDIDSPNSSLADQDLIGSVECCVANIVAAGSKGHREPLERPVTSKATFAPGTILLFAEELAILKNEVFLRLCGDSSGTCCSACFMPKTFYTISKINEANRYVVVYRSPDVKGLSPVWPSVTLSGQSICNGDQDRKLKIDMYHLDVKGEDKHIGSSPTTLNRMASETEQDSPLVAEDGQLTKTTLSILACIITPVYTFVDYVQAGTRIHLCFSIDFTSSNGDPTHATSLHHISKDPTITNPYEQAIEATGLIIQDYDNTGIFPVYGFGARTPPTGTVSHDFSVTLGTSPNCKGILGVIRAYRQCISRVQLFGPTNFAPVINKVAAMASRCKAGQHYYVLVILTDGEITDMFQTKEAIIKASVFPLSIIIVGVGDADFTSMKLLDGDDNDEKISFMGKTAERDIVQFVEYRNSESWLRRAAGDAAFRKRSKQGVGKPPPGTKEPPKKDVMANIVSNARAEMAIVIAQAQLAEEILAEVPEQLTGYMKDRGIEPSMIKVEDAIPDHLMQQLFVGVDGPDVAQNCEKMKKLMAARKEERRRKEEERTRKIKKEWNLMSMVGIGKSRMTHKPPPVTKQPMPRP